MPPPLYPLLLEVIAVDPLVMHRPNCGARVVLVWLSLVVGSALAQEPAAVEPVVTLSSAADPEIGRTFRDCSDCPEMVVIAPGRFLMGSEPAETEREGVPELFAGWERPRHPVAMASALAVSKYHVTRGEYARFVHESGHRGAGCYVWTPETIKSDDSKSWRDPGFPQTDRDPVVCVSWYDARAYAAWLSRITGKPYRLPTEAEWEYAARAGTTTAWPWGDNAAAICGHANGADQAMKELFVDWKVAPCRDNYVFTSPAGRFQPNAFGLHDMLGNAWQWTEDCFVSHYRDAPGNAAVARAWEDCAQRVLRGGSWNNGPGYSRAGVRDTGGAVNRDSINGFRVVRGL
jgi:formylglycine-generating enzyme